MLQSLAEETFPVAELVAQGPEPHQRWRRRLPLDEPVTLGRQSPPWDVPWDPYVSRAHARLLWDGRLLHVERLPETANPIFFQGEEVQQAKLSPGQSFHIGDTQFLLVQERIEVVQDLPEPLHEQTFSVQFLRQLPFRNAAARLEALSRLPRAMQEARNEQDLAARLLAHLLSALGQADAVALVQVHRPQEPQAQVQVVQWDGRFSHLGTLRPSRRLILEALRSGQSVLHIWHAQPGSPAAFTVAENQDWAFCVPVPSGQEAPWAIYVSGRSQSPLSHLSTDAGQLREDVKFTEIVAALLGAIRHVQALQRRQATLAQFFPPAVLEVLQSRPAQEVLAPQKTRASVLFCDLRGFSRKAEQEAGDLLGLLQRVSRALGVMTRRILDQGGVIGDFHGDAAMGFWGWPLQRADQVGRACRAALAIACEFEQAAAGKDETLRDFRVGIGLATGEAVAGGIGTDDQLKVTVFGPVVNLASRLEGMTRLFHAAILMDETTAEAARRLPPEVARCRRVARVRPYGMEQPVWVSQLLRPEAEHPFLKNQHLAWYEEAVDHFTAGRWSEALELLHRVPPQDRVKDFLTQFILQRDRTPPPDWEGVISLDSKG